ncbi:hypothetical protein MUU74_08465 [Chryseobacterium daecheongense]|uniref:hypothetical protein n=1 Tax=Chryseobacterium daecheongense TaxID=192389 RepID=UPI001FD6B714|nr:hypothetical protein [Chryseobacterium daecheongense]UOU99975.1 hypothetical protein MUU74_08465 [Chryseobacterium daecheongense]
MKNFLLLLGMALFVLSCKKTETQDNSNVTDSATISNDTISDTITSTAPADTLSAAQDSINRSNTKNGNMNNNKADSLNR